MTAKTQLVCLQNISTYYLQEYKSNKKAQRIIDAENSSKSRIISLVAEETESGQIFLIEKFQYFAALKKKDSQLRIPCLIYPSTTEKERLLHILKINIPLEKDIGWLFYHRHIMKLVEEHNMTIDEIAILVNQEQSKIKSFTFDQRIPIHIREEVIEKNAKTVVQNICSSTIIPKKMKTILYEKAILDKGHIYRLTVEKLEHFKELCIKRNIPISLLHNQSRLEQFVDNLLLNNFYLDNHFNTLSPSSYSISNQWFIFVTKYELTPKEETEQLNLFEK